MPPVLGLMTTVLLGSSTPAASRIAAEAPEAASEDDAKGGAYRAPTWAPAMRAALLDALEGYPGRLGLQIVDVARREAFGHRAEVPMYLASGVKLAFMIAAFREIEAGRLHLGETLRYGDDDVRDGAPRVNRLRPGQSVRVAELLEHMMRFSDNAASDLLVKRMGLDTVSRALVEEGIDGFGPITRMIDVRRGVFRALDVRADDLDPFTVRRIRWTRIWDPQIRRLERAMGRPPHSLDKAQMLAAYERFYATGVNRAPMRAVALIFERLLEGTLVSSQASRAMLALMDGARTSRNRLLGRLPRNARVAHKTGSQYLRFCDLGVVFLEEGPLVISMCTEQGELQPSERLMATVARRAYDLAREARKP